MSLPGLLILDTVTVESPIGGVDDSGGFLVSPWQPFATGPGRVEDADAKLRQQYAAQGSVITHTVFTQIEGITQGQRITTREGLRLLVEGVLIHRAMLSIPTYYTVVCKRVQL